MPITLEQRFGEHLRSMRHERGFTQEELAERCGLSVDAVRRIERGRFSASLGTIAKLARGLGVSLRTLFETFEDPGKARVKELSDYLATRKPAEIRLAIRVLRVLFEER